MWIFEQSLPIIIIAVIGGALLAGTLLQTGKQLFLYLLLGWIAICSLMLGLEYVIVTERERIEGAVYELAAAIRENDIQAISSCISDDAPDVKADAEGKMRLVQIQSVTVKRNLTITFIQDTPPQLATAKMNIKVSGRLESNPEFGGDFATFLVLTFQKDPDDKWRVVSYEFFDPRGEQAGKITPPV